MRGENQPRIANSIARVLQPWIVPLIVTVVAAGVLAAAVAMYLIVVRSVGDLM
jgi:hypothetical protein